MSVNWALIQYGPEPTGRSVAARIASGSYTSSSTMLAAGSASAYPNWLSAQDRLKSMVVASGVSMVDSASSCCADEPATPRRSALAMLNFTSLLVRAWPFENLRFALMLQRYFSCDRKMQSVAASGWSAVFPSSRVRRRWKRPITIVVDIESVTATGSRVFGRSVVAIVKS